MATTTITQADLDTSAARMRDAASKGYAAYSQACADHKVLMAGWTAQQPERRIVVKGNTYPHRKALAGLGLRWSDGLRAWTGVVRGEIDLPRGCHETTQGAAALESMDYAGSAY